jgi:3-hydroxyisobutyrate dehydrogenase
MADRVALLGTGIMGAPMARNLLKAGLDVTVWNRSTDKARSLSDDGAEVADKATDAVANADFVLTMLADGPAVESVMSEAASAVRDGAVWLQMSTVGIDATERLAQIAADHGITFVDAPVLGTKQPAEQAQLIVLASGPGDALERARPVFDAVGSKVVELGEAGNGSRMKLVLNSWLVALVEGLAETISFAEAIGVDPAKFLEIIDGGPMGPPYAALKGKMMIERDFPASFPLRLSVKDARLVLEAAQRKQIELPLVETVVRQMERAAESGHAEEDLAATIYATAPSE